MTKRFWTRAALMLAAMVLTVGGTAGVAAAAAASFTGTGHAPEESTALQLALADAQQNAAAAGYAASQCAITDQGWDYQPSNGGYLATVTLGCGTTVTVPAVGGDTLTAATATLQAAGLAVTSHNVIVWDSTDVGRVVSQTPSAGSRVEKGRTVNLGIGLWGGENR